MLRQGFWHALWKPRSGDQDWLKYDQVANDEDYEEHNYKEDNDKDLMKMTMIMLIIRLQAG